MALKSTVYKAQLQISDMDRSVYGEHSLTLARHPSENDERLLMRVLAFGLTVPADDLNGRLEFTAGLSDTDVPDLWRKDLTGEIQQWVEVGLPDERRLAKACSRASEVQLFAFGSSVPIWWQGLVNKVSRLDRLSVWQVPLEASKAMAELAERSMQLQLTVQDGQVWLSEGERTVEFELVRLKGG